MREPDDEEIVAALAAVRCFLETSEFANEHDERPAERWRWAGRLAAQGVAATRAATPTWGNVERLRRM